MAYYQLRQTHYVIIILLTIPPINIEDATKWFLPLDMDDDQTMLVGGIHIPKQDHAKQTNLRLVIRGTIFQSVCDG